MVLLGEAEFGIAPVESMACGRPVVALGRGGALETVVPGVTGYLVADATPALFAEAMQTVMHTSFDAQVLAAHAAAFSVAHFEASFDQLVRQGLTSGAAC